MGIDPSLFKAYDIRGIWGKNLLSETSYQIGLGMGSFFINKGVTVVYVSHDNRVSSEEINKNFVQGLRESGCDVVDLGRIPTPMNYASWYLYSANATVSITASHNPPEYNGLKATIHKKHFDTNEYQEIKNIVLDGSFQKAKKLGTYTSKDIWPLYRARVLKDIHLARDLTVVLDCGNGTCSTTTDILLKDIGCTVIKLYCEHDGRFPNHAPYPQKEALYTTLKTEIIRNHADCGIAMDGDGDRFGVYDEKGRFVSNDLIGALIAGSMAENNPGMKAVFNISTSQMAIDYAQQAGCSVILWKTGYPNIIAKMKETGALLGNEIAGHFFLKDTYFGFDDGSYAALRFVEYLSRQNRPVSELVSSMPQYISTPEFRVTAPDEPNNNKFTIVSSIIRDFRQKFSDAQILDFDGLRITFPDKSWILIRNSNTEPLITGRTEAKTEDRLNQHKKLIVDTLLKHGVILDWTHPITSH